LFASILSRLQAEQRVIHDKRGRERQRKHNFPPILAKGRALLIGMPCFGRMRLRRSKN